MLKYDAVVKELHQESFRTDIPPFKAGDSINVYFKIVEGNKERVQLFAGVVIQRKGHKFTEMITVRKISNGIGVERVFPLHSPFIDRIEVMKRGFVRRARIYYLRKLQGKAARIRGEKKAQ